MVGGSLLAARHRHDLVGGVAFIADAAQMGNGRTPFTDDVELDLTVRQQPELFADRLGKGDLSYLAPIRSVGLMHPA